MTIHESLRCQVELGGPGRSVRFTPGSTTAPISSGTGAMAATPAIAAAPNVWCRSGVCRAPIGSGPQPLMLEVFTAESAANLISEPGVHLVDNLPVNLKPELQQYSPRNEPRRQRAGKTK